MWDALTRIADVLAIFGIPTLLASAIGGYRLLRAQQAKKSYIAKVRDAPDDQAAVLIVQVKKEAEAAVERYRQQNEELSVISADRVLCVAWDEYLTAENSPDLTRAIEAKARQLAEMGVWTVHLFVAGPLTAAAIVGATLGNQFRVFLYGSTRGTTDERYEQVGLLEPRV